MAYYVGYNAIMFYLLLFVEVSVLDFAFRCIEMKLDVGCSLECLRRRLFAEMVELFSVEMVCILII